MLEFAEKNYFKIGNEEKDYGKYNYEQDNGILPSRYVVQYKNKEFIRYLTDSNGNFILKKNKKIPDYSKKYNAIGSQTPKFFIEKKENNYPFKLQEGLEGALKFKIVHSDDILFDREPTKSKENLFVNIGNRALGYKNIYLYNEKYKLYLSLNDMEQNYNSFVILNQVYK